MTDLNDLHGWNIGETKISEDLPAGENPRNNEDFETVEEQLSRLVDIHDHKPINWPLVSELSEKILSEQGKDLSVAVWFLVARMNVENTKGLAIGVHVLKTVICLYWQDMTPPLRRLRARRNIIYWLFDQVKGFVEKDNEAIDGSLYQQLTDDWLAIDSFWHEVDEDDSPPFYGLKRALAALPIIEEPEELADAQEHLDDVLRNTGIVSESIGKELGVMSSSDISESHSDKLQEIEQIEHGLSKRNEKPLVNDSASKQEVAAPSFSSDGFADSPLAAVDKALDNFSEFVYHGLADASSSLVFFRLNRLCAWATVESVPFNDNGQSHIPAPSEQIMTSCNLICEQGDINSIVNFAETQLYSHRFWLDLNRMSYDALLAANQKESAELVKLEFAHLISRLPDLINITFSNDKPFADEQTKQWIAGMSPGNAVTATAASDKIAIENGVDQLIHEVVSATNKINVVTGMEKLQYAIEKSSSLQERFKIEAAQLEILVKNRCCVDSEVFIKPLLEALEKYHLIDWEPSLAANFLENGIKLIELDSKAKSSTKKLLFSHLASVSMSKCWKLLYKS